VGEVGLARGERAGRGAGGVEDEQRGAELGQGAGDAGGALRGIITRDGT